MRQVDEYSEGIAKIGGAEYEVFHYNGNPHAVDPENGEAYRIFHTREDPVLTKEGLSKVPADFRAVKIEDQNKINEIMDSVMEDMEKAFPGGNLDDKVSGSELRK